MWGLLARCVSPQPAWVLWDQAAAFPAWSCPRAGVSFVAGGKTGMGCGETRSPEPGAARESHYSLLWDLAESLPFSGPLFAIVVGRG